MGCLLSKEGGEDTTKPAEKKVYSWDREDRPDPKDFTIANETGTTCGRTPGTVNGQQFIIDNCKDASIFIYDNSAMITVDNCENCTIFLGPIKGSLFVRNSKNCKLAAACQQFRVRDCRNFDTFLYCTSQPIIESSTSMRFACFTYFYPELPQQFSNANLSVFNNGWSNIYDFTPVQDSDDNWSLISEKTTVELFFSKPDAELFQSVEVSTDVSRSVVPLSRGKRNVRFPESCLLVLFGDSKSKCRDVLGKLGNVDLMQSKEMIGLEDIKRVLKDERYCDLCNGETVIGLELNSADGLIANVQNALEELGVPLEKVFLSKDSSSAKADIDAFFSFVSMTMS